MIDPTVIDIVERAVGGECIPPDELLPLFDLETLSPEVAHIRWAARTITARACGNVGQIYAQIGIDGLPCPADCQFCSFAASRSKGFAGAIVPLEDVVDYARLYDEEGVHLISLMATAGLPFDRVLETVRAVRAAISDDMPILCNMGDIDEDQARQLAEAGAQAAYHAHRLGEGDVTRIDPERRLATMRAIRSAGLRLMNAVEPVREGVSARAILDRMVEASSFEPYCSGVGTLTVVPGSPMETCAPLSRARTAFYAAIFRLLVGESVPFGTGGGNVVWADAGTNPRARDLSRNPDDLRREVRRLRKQLAGDEWEVPARPIPGWFA